MGKKEKLHGEKVSKHNKVKRKKKKDKVLTNEKAKLHLQASKESQPNSDSNSQVQTPDSNKSLSKGRSYTLSVAVPGSILDNAQSPELRTYLAGQIARALVIFQVDEVVIFDESGKTVNEDAGEFTGITRKDNDPNKMLANILQYLECPQYLRKYFFPKHPDLRYAGLLNPLNSTHHMLIDEDVPYREGVTLDRPTGKKGSLANCGMRKEVRIDRQLQPGLRVTVKLDTNQTFESKTYNGTVVSVNTPRMDAGIYWGYRVRIARSLGAAIAECPYEDGYDLSIGTSDLGDPVEELNLSSFKHILIAFGGLSGLEAALESDESLRISDIRSLFDHYINTCPEQGSRIIRTEEAMLISLAAIRPKIVAAANMERGQ